MKWNYRIVNTKSQNGGEDWYCLQEVFYDDKGVPCGYCDPCTGSETMDSMREVWEMMSGALERPPLQEEDITGDHNFEADDDDDDDEDDDE